MLICYELSGTSSDSKLFCRFNFVLVFESITTNSELEMSIGYLNQSKSDVIEKSKCVSTSNEGILIPAFFLKFISSVEQFVDFICAFSWTSIQYSIQDLITFR